MIRIVLWIVTLLRVVLIPVFLALALRAQELGRSGMDPDAYRLGALAVLLVMGVSDLVDGWVARRFDLTSQLGAVVDAVADKLVQVSLAAFFALSEGPAFASLPLWFLVLVVGRDLILGLGVLVIRARHGPIRVVHQPHGRVASLSVFAVLLWVAIGLPEAGLLALMLLAASLNVVSATSYAWNGISQGREAARQKGDAVAGGLSRRHFLVAWIGWLGGWARPGRTAAGATSDIRDPRLTARPGRPTLSPEPGATRLVPELERGAIVYVPESYSEDVPAPLLVTLHGSGGRARFWARLYEECEARGMILLAPDSRGDTWDRVRGSFGPDVQFLDSALRYIFARCAVDPGRIALAGFSDGASYALSLGPSNGDLFTHLIAFSPGFSNPEDPIVGSPRVFVSHGSEDRILSVLASRILIVPMFELDGYDIRYREFMGGHEMPPQIVNQALDWFTGGVL